jgi:hypothetical protein
MDTPLFRTLDDVRDHVRLLAARRVEESSSYQAWQLTKRVTLMTLLAAAALQYYLISVMNEVMSMPDLTVNVQHLLQL